MNGAELLCRALSAQGVDVVFGHPGGAILPFYDALFRVGAPRHVLMRHEQGAAHAADGYARVTGRPGVCVATSGPGATNLVTGLATSLMDGVPIVAVTGQVSTAVMGTDAFQEIDILGITLPVTKHGYLVERVGDLPRIVAEAFRLALSGRPGPVLIDVPKDVQNAAYEGAPPAPVREKPKAAAPVDTDALERVVALVNQAQRPVVMAGRGVVISETTAVLRALAEVADLPVVTTLLGLDAFPASHPLALGMPGMHGTARANHAIQRADLIIGLGLRFDDRVIGRRDRFAPLATIIHADIDPASVGRTIRAAVPLIGDLRVTLPALASRTAPAKRPAWWTEISQWSREAEPEDGARDTVGPLTGRAATRALAVQIAAAGAAVTTDVGQHQMWLAQELLDAAPGTHLTSGGLGTMGYGLPAALGAAVARPGRPVWAVLGDGGFQMTVQELATLADERLPVRVAVMNNGFLGMVRQWQELFYDRRYSASAISNPDFVLLAKAYGIPARAVSRIEELDAALQWADGVTGPVLLDLQIAREENVYPLVPSGAALDEMVMAPRTSGVAG